MGSAKTPENVSTDFSLMVIGSLFPPAKVEKFYFSLSRTTTTTTRSQQVAERWKAERKLLEPRPHLQYNHVTTSLAAVQSRTRITRQPFNCRKCTLSLTSSACR